MLAAARLAALQGCNMAIMNGNLCREGEGRQRRQAQGVDSYIGAIVDMSDAEDGEVVEEDGMFDMVYSGHCNKQGCKEVCPHDTCTRCHKQGKELQLHCKCRVL